MPQFNEKQKQLNRRCGNLEQISASLMDKVDTCEIRHELKDLKLSDHWPVTLDIRVDINITPPSSGSQSDL